MKKKIAVLCVTILVLAGMLAVFLYQSGTAKVKKKRHLQIACVGDSITYGAGVQKIKNATYEYFLRQNIGGDCQVLNYGKSGRTLQKEGNKPYVNTTFYQNSVKVKADVYILMLGTNDSKKINWNEKRYSRELRTFVRTYQKLPNHPLVYLMAPPDCFPQGKTGIVGYHIQQKVIAGRIRKIVRKTAAREQTGFVDLYAVTKNHPEYFVDGVHPNQKGNQKIADVIYQALKKDNIVQ